MRFGVAVPTCVEGMVYPLPFGNHDDILHIATEAENLGYQSILVNDHLSTQQYVRDTFSTPPRYYEPLVTLAWLAGSTSQIRLMTGVIVLPMRDPVLLAKQVSSLDHISGGRITLGVGVGGYREEFEAVRPDLKHVRRADLVAEGLQALRILFRERRGSMDGELVGFDDVEMYPKPVQDPLPIYSSGNADGSLRRAAQLCDGWIPAGMPMARLQEMIHMLTSYAQEVDRSPDEISIAPQYVMCLGTTKEGAEQAFRQSQVHEHLVSLRKSTLKNQAIDTFVPNNLIGTPDDVAGRVSELADLGVSELAGMIVVADTPGEVIEQMQMFASEVMPAFAGTGGSNSSEVK